MQTDNAYRWLEKSLAAIEKANWYRHVKPIDSRPGAIVNLDGKPTLNFASNDYLGLAGDDRLIAAATQATQTYGTGSSGSRLLSGHRPLHRELEIQLAALKQTEDALVFSSGYLANLGTIAALVGARDLILGDRDNHASLKHGARLSGATILDYHRRNLDDLRSQLERERSRYRRCLIATDTVFSMDGDLCPLPELLDLAEKFECMVLVDEAHATGVFGATGGGCVEHFGCTGRAIVQVGTLSKALGSLGGYVAGSALLVDFLRNRAPTWIYTTGLSPADTAAAIAALNIIRSEPQRRDRLWENVAQLRSQVPSKRWLPSDSPILCWSYTTPKEAIAAAQKLRSAGIFAPAIRPPTVPTSRIRFSVMATHESQHIQHVISILRELH